MCLGIPGEVIEFLPDQPDLARVDPSGHVTDDPPGIVQLKTAFGGRRIVDLLVGDPLPRIC